MYNTTRLQKRIDEKFESRAAFARALGVDKSTVKWLLEGHDWRGSKLMTAIKLLDIKPDEILDYFFIPGVAEKQPQKV